MMTTFDPHLYLKLLNIESSEMETESPLRISPDTPSSNASQEQILSSQFYSLSEELIDHSMYDPSLLPDSSFSGSYLPTDPMLLGDLDYNALAKLPFNTSNSFDATAKPSPTPSLAIEGQYRLSPMSSRNDSYSSSISLEVTTERDNTTDVSKRIRGSEADDISACWTSPLCPHKTKEGKPPDPSTCNGGCVPFLFDDAVERDDFIDTALLAIDITADDNYVPIDTAKAKLKRNESSRSETEGKSLRHEDRQTKVATGTRSAKKGSSTEREIVVESIEEADPKEKKRIPHNEVERKYRDSVNNQMNCLRRVVPVLQPTSRICTGGDMEDLPAPSKPSKAAILASATAYIKQLEREKKEQLEQNDMLQARVKMLQALVKCDDCSLMQYVKGMSIRGTNT